MAISSAGLGSNLDVNLIVSQLMALERRPLDALNARKTSYNNKISAYGTISSGISAFQSAVSALKDSSGFKVFSSTVADTGYLTASADSTATAASHTITITQLAKAQNLVSTAIADTNSTTLGTGSLTIGNGTDTFTVDIDSSNNTLDGIVNAINSNTDNFGVSASIINDGTGNRLLLAPNSTGASNAITVSVNDTGDSNNTDSNGLSRLSYVGGAFNMTQTQAAQDAIITVNGLTGIQKASNTITDVIKGVTLNLKKDNVTTTVDVATDTAAITGKVQAVVDAYNKLVNDIKSLRGENATLEADNTLLTIQSQLVGIFNTPAAISGNAYSYLSEVGLSIQTDGTIALDSAAFESALSSNFNSVVNVFTDSTHGFMQRFYSETSAMLQTDGLVDARTDGLNALITDIDSRILQLEVRLVSTEERLRKQFAALDALLGTLNSTNTILLQQLQ